MDSLGRQPAGGSERWPRPGIAGLRPLAGDGVSRRPKAVSNPRERTTNRQKAPEGRQIFGCGVSRSPPVRTSVAAPRLTVIWGAGILGLTPQAIHMSPLRGSRHLSPKQLLGVTSSVSPEDTRVGR